LFKIPISITKTIKAHALDLAICPDPQLSFRIEESKSSQYIPIDRRYKREVPSTNGESLASHLDQYT
jgi:hypothetical protein